jgi:hypothetical protein
VPGRGVLVPPPPNLDQTSGDQLFHSFCDVGVAVGTGRVQRLQTFHVSRNGYLTLQFNTFQRFRPRGPLYIDIVRRHPDGRIETLATYDLNTDATSIGWSPRVQPLVTAVWVSAGAEYGFTLRADLGPAGSQECYGFAYSDESVYGGGSELYSKDDGRTWSLEAGRALKFTTLVRPSL